MNLTTGAKFQTGEPADWFSGGGEMGALIRQMDWERTPLGPISSWSPSLKMMARFLLANRFPLLLWWGPEFCQIYNDAYRPILGTKHPHFLGRPVSECWSEIWHILKPLIETPFNGGPSTWMEDMALEINRYGYVEESHFTIAYSPVPDETVPSGIGGVLATVHEITEKVVGERRIVTLRDLSTHSFDAKTVEEACDAAAATLTEHAKDVPFALIYLIDSDGKRARLACAAGVETGNSLSPEVIALDHPDAEAAWPLPTAIRTESAVIVENLSARFGNDLPAGPWPDPPSQAVITPVRSNIAHQLAGLLVVGVSSRLRLDDSYRSFMELAAGQIATAVTNARAYEEERKRAEALAELDRAKTAFFSNVSHEFRTPLTLMLGPLEDALTEDGLPPDTQETLKTAHRNSLRLLKLVNTLLDFSRIEAGRIDAVYEPVELATFTSDLASNFRSAIERAGLKLVVDCPKLDEVVYVDREMWEKIVLNLLSNAFKFSFAGEIRVAVKPAGETVELIVSDNGTGITSDELPHLFERFHRVKDARGRSYEGSGIGLALVMELVKLHGGNIRVTSEVDRGTTFTISIPTGTAHLDEQRIGAPRVLSSTGLRAQTFVEEASRWLPAESGFQSAAPARSTHSQTAPNSDGRILLADDNADMREYLCHLIASNYEVVAVADGQAALAEAEKSSFDLVLTDIMMPRLDGFGLLRALRADDRTRAIPVIMLSARAGEEQRVEGLAAGADDYLVKPFSARELLARIESNLKLARLRHEQERRKDEFLATLAHELRNPLAPINNGLQLIRLAGGDPATLNQARGMMERQLQHLQRLVDDLLDVSRISRNKLELRKEFVELDAVVRSAIETSRPLIESANQELIARMPDESVLIDADPIRLAQAFANLLNNAAKYSEKPGQILLEAQSKAEGVEIRVRDTGIGIPADKLPTIFDMFVQVDSSLERSQGGLGIGLTLVKRLIQMHGGTVEVRSDGPGKGSEFIVRLPRIVLTRSATPVVLERADENGKQARRRILVVDDNLDSAESLAMMLELLGHDVTAAHDGLEAVEVAKTFAPELAFLDVGMPRMNGYDAARLIRQQPECSGVMLVALTGWGQEEDKQRSYEAGFDVHMVKPIDFDAVEKLISEL